MFLLETLFLLLSSFGGRLGLFVSFFLRARSFLLSLLGLCRSLLLSLFLGAALLFSLTLQLFCLLFGVVLRCFSRLATAFLFIEG